MIGGGGRGGEYQKDLSYVAAVLPTVVKKTIRAVCEVMQRKRFKKKLELLKKCKKSLNHLFICNCN